MARLSVRGAAARAVEAAVLAVLALASLPARGEHRGPLPIHVLATAETLEGPPAVALDPALNRVTLADPKTGRLLLHPLGPEMSLGPRPFALRDAATGDPIRLSRPGPLLALREGGVAVADAGAGCVYVADRRGFVSRRLDLPARTKDLGGLAHDERTGLWYATDPAAGRVLRADAGRFMPWGPPRRLRRPAGLAFLPSGRLLVADWGANALSVLDRRGKEAARWPLEMQGPWGLAVLPQDRAVLVTGGSPSLDVLDYQGRRHPRFVLRPPTSLLVRGGAPLPIATDGRDLAAIGQTDRRALLLRLEAIRDLDADGLLDSEETHTFGTDPARRDTDGDGLSDYDEVWAAAPTDPLLVDTDGDGASDGRQARPDPAPTTSGGLPGWAAPVLAGLLAFGAVPALVRRRASRRGNTPR